MNAHANLNSRSRMAVLLLAASLALFLAIYFADSPSEKDLQNRVENSTQNLRSSIMSQIEGTKIRTQSSYPEETLSALCKNNLRGKKSWFQDKHRMDPGRISLSYHPPHLADVTIK